MNRVCRCRWELLGLYMPRSLYTCNTACCLGAHGFVRYRKESARILPHMCPCERRSRIKPYMRSCAGNKVAVKPKTIPMAGSVDSRTCKIHLCNSTRLVPGQGEICWCNSAPPESRRNGSGRTRVIGVFEGVVCPFAVVLRSLGAALMREMTS